MGLRGYVESEGFSHICFESSEVADISSTDDGEIKEFFFVIPNEMEESLSHLNNEK